MTKEQIVFPTNGAGRVTSTCERERENQDPNLTPFTKIQLKWILDPNVKHIAIKLLDDPGCGDAFFDVIPKTQSMKETIDS